MSKPILEIAKELLELEKKAAPGDYWVECVHDNYGGIGYEVSAKSQSLHVIFHENNCMDQKITAKVQANLYAQSRNHLRTLCEALVEADWVMKYYSKTHLPQNADVWLKRFAPSTSQGGGE